MKAMPHLYYVHENHLTFLQRPRRPSHVYSDYVQEDHPTSTVTTSKKAIPQVYYVHEYIQNLYYVRP